MTSQKPAGKRQYPRLGIFRVFDLGAWHELDRENVFGGLEPVRYPTNTASARAMIEKKVEGQEIKGVAPAPRRTGQVVDIFAALKKSLETAGQQKSQTADRGK